ncbi:hypothetical protein PAXRUDRAFT_824572 [Paxillus rubicundulus Ve08.2h10]|uniref:BSD domain-containing protein n=1 Tax=Paxillus rubicundulus Ve08.2h10 TaxID=930991 RepID=A0A0D0DU92_9AGAM|nr:hypothetical protein PAXRUDRAFT_824572 [Paxillus rubicundulus Ve08.2h10]
MPSVICTAKASYKKQLGSLELTEAHLQWTQDGKKAPSVRVPHQDAASLFCSKEGAAQVRLKLGLINDDAGHNFTFTSTPQGVAYSERETFKMELTNIISRNRSSGLLAVAPTTTTATTIAPTVATPTLKGPVTTVSSHAPTPLPASRASTSRAASVASDGRVAILSEQDAAKDFRLRKKVLLASPELLALHKELVMGGQITEAEFWEGREHLLLAQAATENQKRGRSGQLVDPRPQTVEGGEVKIVITPQLVHDIFEEFPVVAKAYNDNVPNKLTEAEFWKRYFQSKLFNAHRASIRSSATQHVVKEDPIFDMYLERDDDELEPRRPREEVSDLFINLGATLEDHGETGNEKDVTMQAGRQRGALPLIRKFNEHSERLLNSALGQGPPSKRRRTDSADKQNLLSQIEYDDLQDHESSPGVLLEMQGRQRYFEGQFGNMGEQREAVDVRDALVGLRNGLDGWEGRFSQLRVEKKSSDAALLSMTQNVASRLDIKTKKSDFPPDLFRQLMTCQTAANEFLRQFWISIYPPPSDFPTPSSLSSTATQRSAKAAKMAGYLGKTHEKVDALVRGAGVEGVEGGRVVVAMKPILDAVDHALAFYRARNVGGGKAVGVKLV